MLEAADVTVVEPALRRARVTTGRAFPSSRHPAVVGTESPRPAPKRRYKFYRPHRVHYYLVLTGISLAVLVCVLNTVAYASRRVDLATIAFFAILVTALVIFAAFFMGFTMVVEGNMRGRRLQFLLPHAAVGLLSPLFYTLNIAAALDSVGIGPVSRLSVAVSYICLGLLMVQFLMGKAVVRPEPLRLITPRGVHRVVR